MPSGELTTYRRAAARGAPTLVESFVDLQGRSESSAAVTTAASLDIDASALANGPWAGLDLSADAVGVVVPAGAGSGGDVTADELVVMAPSSAVPGIEWLPGRDYIPGSEWISGSEWIPGIGPKRDGDEGEESRWIPESEWTPGSEWILGSEWLPDDASSLQVMLTTGEESRPDTFGRDSLPGESLVEAGGLDWDSAVLAAPLSTFEIPPTTWSRETVLDGATPAPMGGRTFGVSVLSADADTGAELRSVEGSDLLASDVGRRLLSSAAGLEGAEYRPAVEVPAGTDTASLLGGETELRTFMTTATTDHGPVGLGVHLAVATVENTSVLVLATHEWPVPAAEMDPTLPEGRVEKAFELLRQILERLDLVSEPPTTFTPTPTPTPTPMPTPTPDRIEFGRQLSTGGTPAIGFDFIVAVESRFSLDFQALDGRVNSYTVPLPVMEQIQSNSTGPSEDQQLFTDNSPPDVTFENAEQGSGTVTLDAGE